jgi:DNA-binding IclR family transcriptional regulator
MSGMRPLRTAPAKSALPAAARPAAGAAPASRRRGGKADLAVKSAVRVFEILEFFREVKRPLRLTEITRRFDYPASSASGLLKTMTSHGYLNFNAATHTYFPTARLSQVVSWVPGMEFEQGAVMHAMRRLHGRIQEWTVLCTVNDIFVEFAEVLRSTHPIQLWSPPGTKHPLVKVVVGWLFLNQMIGGQNPENAPQIAHLYRQSIERGVLSQSELPLKALYGRLRGLRGKEYIFTTPETYAPHKPPGHLGGSMVSMLVPCPPTHRPLAIAVGGPADRIATNLKGIVTEMRNEIANVATARDRIFAEFLSGP